MSPSVTVADFGLTGALGASVLKSLQSEPFASKIQFPIKAITRHDVASTDKIQYIKSDLSNPEEVAKALKGTDVIVELLAPNPVLFAAVEKILSIVKPKFFIPSQFGCDVPAVQTFAPGFLGLKSEHSENARAAGIKTVDVVTGYFAIPGSFLYEIVGSVGIDPEAKTYTIRGDISQEIAISKAEDIGNTVAALVTSDVATIPDVVRVFSEEVSDQKVISTYEKNHNVKLTKAETFTAQEALEQFKEDWAKGFDPAQFLYYLHVIASQGVDKGSKFSRNDREFVNPGESLWKWGKF